MAAGMFLQSYSAHQVLSKLGFHGNMDELETFEVEAYTLISQEYQKLEKEELDLLSKKKR